MTFNQQLIQKARKGDIAILNDGTTDQLCEVLSVCCSQYQGNPSGTAYVYEVRNGKWFAIGVPNEANLPAHSVKDFFMPEIKLDGPDITGKFQEEQQPRTYKVTRQQMKEIWEAADNEAKNAIELGEMPGFNMFENERQFNEAQVKRIVNLFVPATPHLLKSIFPEYFFIPEGEPVLVRDYDGHDWHIRISDGQGKCYVNGNLKGDSITPKQMIPFTKNPPK